MLSSAQSVAPKPAAMPPAAPAAQPALPGAGSAGRPSFAQFLNDQADLALPHTDPVPQDPDTASEATAAPAPAANTAPARRKEGNTPYAKAAPSSQARTPEATDAGKTTKAVGDSAETTDAAKDSVQDLETSGLNEFTQLIGLAVAPQAGPQPMSPGLPGAEAATESGAKGARGARAGRVSTEEVGEVATHRDAAEAATTSTGERRPAEAHNRAADAPHAKGIEIAADKAAAARSASSEALQQATTSAPGDASPRMAAVGDVAPPSFSAMLAQALPAAAAAGDTAPTAATSQVHAALHSSAFAPELGARVSLLAVDGVQQAELQLNPADMGPVAVQIVVDGSQAQVSFHAVQAETRQALEQSLPDLAAALQSQGLTLSGGGVFQQAQRDAQGGDTEAGSGGDGRGSRTNTAGGRGASSSVAAPVRRSVGLLDTFA
ncbi:flagellar hook-length control protein FliK [Pelomonas saccharophila]|uniref:Flagellar hook-length control protein FliK n=1 Tax=Roseateles saccharophilus TaxID=304 RepID=A0ABU1YJ04_ROSSA|nr:flagellar hook-length control protein FliK [Roseateles saccharophilus]MDR7268833.1 flagellar hook-length control protein FliK [Roseateles saccharophilus]